MQLAGVIVVAGFANGMVHPAGNLAIVRGVSAARRGAAFGIKQAAAPLATLLAGLAIPVFALTSVWMLAAMVVAVRQALAVLGGEPAQLGVGEAGEVLLNAVDLADGTTFFPATDSTYRMSFALDGSIDGWDVCNRCAGSFEEQGDSTRVFVYCTERGCGCTEQGCKPHFPLPLMTYGDAFNHAVLFEREDAKLLVHFYDLNGTKHVLRHALRN